MIRAIGIDLALANMGLARVEINHPTQVNGTSIPLIRCLDLKLVSTEADNSKQVRKGSDNLRRAIELHRALHAWIQDAQVIFAEIPHGGALSAAAATSLAIAVGLLASVPIPIIEVSPLESRQAISGQKKKPVSKAEAIEWAEKHWPDAPWVRYTKAGRVVGKGKKLIAQWKAGDLQACNEHIADAMAVIAAGIQTPAFQQLLALQSHATPSSTHSRPASRRIALD